MDHSIILLTELLSANPYRKIFSRETGGLRCSYTLTPNELFILQPHVFTGLMRNTPTPPPTSKYTKATRVGVPRISTQYVDIDAHENRESQYYSEVARVCAALGCIRITYIAYGGYVDISTYPNLDNDEGKVAWIMYIPPDDIESVSIHRMDDGSEFVDKALRELTEIREAYGKWTQITEALVLPLQPSPKTYSHLSIPFISETDNNVRDYCDLAEVALQTYKQYLGKEKAVLLHQPDTQIPIGLMLFVKDITHFN